MPTINTTSTIKQTTPIATHVAAMTATSAVIADNTNANATANAAAATAATQLAPAKFITDSIISSSHPCINSCSSNLISTIPPLLLADPLQQTSSNVLPAVVHTIATCCSNSNSSSISYDSGSNSCLILAPNNEEDDNPKANADDEQVNEDAQKHDPNEDPDDNQKAIEDNPREDNTTILDDDKLQIPAADADDNEADKDEEAQEEEEDNDEDAASTQLPAMAGDLILTHEQHDFHLEGDIEQLPEILQGSDQQKLSGEFAYFYPYDGSEPSLLLIGKDFYINVTPQPSR